MQDIINEVQDFLTHSADPLQSRFSFQGRPSDASLRDSPLVLVLGNHSSGKSTFVNYYTQQAIQLTGMAPTDDDFTILRHGGADKERSGGSLVTNPELGLEGLSQFGPKFLSHLKMKSVNNPRLKEITLVDTPGMIDSADSEANRGYDFKGVVRWFAERADLIMLFFDPERPGTTAETLEVYTSALSDFDHKLQVVFNKVDQFSRLTDFARCYGNLCWNLGKVMRTKDLPQIYATFVPRVDSEPSALPLKEFVEARELLIRKIENTSLQRVDNVLTDVSIYVDRLLLHVEVLSMFRTSQSRLSRQLFMVGLLIGGAASWWAWAMSAYEEPIRYLMVGASLFVSVFIALSVSTFIGRQRIKRYDRHPDDAFTQYSSIHRVEHARYHHLKSQWNLVSHLTIRALKELGPAGIPKLKTKESKALNQWRIYRLPQLRRVVHQRENDALSESVDELIQVSAEEADLLLGQSNHEESLIAKAELDVEPKLSM